MIEKNKFCFQRRAGLVDLVKTDSLKKCKKKSKDGKPCELVRMDTGQCWNFQTAVKGLQVTLVIVKSSRFQTLILQVC